MTWLLKTMATHSLTCLLSISQNFSIQSLFYFGL
ncbi:hypothetical protein glysoja_001709 [Glycine soja]|nr:hypothetical protein glysoja_001709 [Glycine soja]